ncbi:hypothetical protein DH86_00003251 [Scytalidium sp. 3C]|nr:hypothetical protein DH86_00003251 [Scytalidium sp. 3C]
MAAELKVGDNLPSDVVFSYIPYTPESSEITACGIPVNYEAGKAFKEKGVDVVAVLAFNDAFVMSAWGKANNIKDDSLLFLSDAGAAFSKRLGWTQGERTARYALIIDHGKIVYAEKEPVRGVTVSGAEAVLAKL